MNASVPSPAPVLTVIRHLQANGYQAFLVGGCVRDSLLGKLPKDFDVASNARPDQVQALFDKVIPTGIQHGTVTVVSGGHHVEVTTFRSEGNYQDGRRPGSVEFQDDITVDLSRRDLTINAMAFDPVSGALVDPFGGQKDIQSKIVRCVGNPLDRFSEDGLRSLRAVRFATVLGFSIDPATEAAISKTLDVFELISRERVRDEFSKILLSNRPAFGLSTLHKTGLLTRFLVEATVLVLSYSEFADRLNFIERSAPVLEVRLALLLEGLESCSIAENALRRLTFPSKVVTATATLLNHVHPRNADDVTLRRLLAAVGPDMAEAVVQVYQARGGGPSRLLEIRDSHPPLYARDLALNGSDIMAILGIGPSKRVGEATRFLLDQVLIRPEVNTRDSLIDLLVY